MATGEAASCKDGLLENGELEAARRRRRRSTGSERGVERRQPGSSAARGIQARHKNIVHLWEFLLELLADESCSSVIAWSRKSRGEFRLKEPEEVAQRWGILKCKQDMTYEKLSRALRHYYKQGIIEKVKGQRLVYKFHKLLYHPNKARCKDDASLSSGTASTSRQGEQYFEDYISTTSDGILDTTKVSCCTDKERLRKIVQERMHAKQRKDSNESPSTEQEEDEAPSSASSNTPSPTCSSPTRQVNPRVLIPVPLRPRQYSCLCGFHVINYGTCGCDNVFYDGHVEGPTTPAPGYGRVGIPFPVIRQFRSVPSEETEQFRGLTRKSV